MNTNTNLKLLMGTVALALVAGACSGSADESTTTSTASTSTTGAAFSLDEVLAQTVAEPEVPGMGATVFTGTETINQAIDGVRQNGGSDAMTLQDRFHIGSNTKAITAALIGRLVEQDLLEFDSTLGDIFGQFPTIDPGFGAVTLRQLLSHTAGINDEQVVESDIDYDESSSPATQRAEAAEWLLARPTNHAAGGEWMYSNVGYALVGAAAERVTGSSFSDLMEAEVFGPLGITTCGLGTPTAEAGQPLGHDAANQPVPLAMVEDPDILSPAGSVTYCTMDGWVRFLQEMMRAYNGESDWLSADTAHEIVEPVAKDYALGWGVVTNGETIAFTHDGSNTLNYSTTWVLPGQDIGWIVVTNASGDPGGLAANLVGFQIGSEYGEM